MYACLVVHTWNNDSVKLCNEMDENFAQLILGQGEELGLLKTALPHR